MAGWTKMKRSDDEICGVVDKLFNTRFWDKGKCSDPACAKEASGIFGPDGHDVFYCRACWIKFFRSAQDDAWKQWKEWIPQERECISESRKEHELKCAMLSLSKVGGSMSFPPDLNGHNRLKVHAFCEREPELAQFSHVSYGAAPHRFIRVASQHSQCAFEEASAILTTASLDSLSVARLKNLQEQLATIAQRFQQEIEKRANRGNEAEDGPDSADIPCKSAPAGYSRQPPDDNEERQAEKSSRSTSAKAPSGPPPKAPSEAASKATSKSATPKSPQCPPPKAATKTIPLIDASGDQAEVCEATHKNEETARTAKTADLADKLQGMTHEVTASDDFPALGGGDFPVLGSGGAGNKKKGGKKR